MRPGWRDGLAKGAVRGMWSESEAESAQERLNLVERVEELGECELVIEAAPENLELKRSLFAELAELCGPEAILATNTSSLSVTAIAAGVERPERVCGMHFFNPPALMRLVEVVAGDDTSAETLAGGHRGRAGDGPRTDPRGRRDRLRRQPARAALHARGAADARRGHRPHDQIDRIVRVGGGFRMGPFELMDLVGVDVNLEVAKSFWEQSFHEPRWQPSPIQARMVAAGRLGRKAGRGYYDYGGGSHRAEDPPAPEVTQKVIGHADPVRIDGEGFVALSMADAPGLGVRETSPHPLHELSGSVQRIPSASSTSSPSRSQDRPGRRARASS